jgi:putative membrane protein
VFFVRWAVHALAVLVASHVVPGIGYDNWAGLVVAVVLLGLLNAFVKPVLLLLSLPLVLVTLGLFLWVINAVLLLVVGRVVTSFRVDGFGAALLGAAVISIVSSLLGGWLGLKSGSVRVGSGRVGGRGPGRGGGEGGGRRGPPGDGGGPVIDV